MAKKLYEESSVQDIAAAIREKNGTATKYKVAEMGAAVRALSGSEAVEWHQCPEAVRNYLANVTYDPSDYSTSQIANYAPADAVISNYKPIGQTVGNKIFYNECPNVQTPFISEGKAGTLKPLDALRWIKTRPTSAEAWNVRDLGGWPCDGGTVQYGLLIRGGRITDADRDVLVGELGVQHEIDLRGKEGRDPSDGEIAVASPLGSDVWFTIAQKAAMYTLTPVETWQMYLRCVIDAVTHREPVYFHCTAGADRTGTLACVLEGLLGMSQSDIDKDYELTTFYSGAGTDANARRRNEQDWIKLISAINEVSGDSFRDKCVHFAVGTCGMTMADINAYRAAMVNGTPETLHWYQTITKNLTGCTISNSVSQVEYGESYTAVLTPESGKSLTSVVVTMGGVDITSAAVSGDQITIQKVTGAVIITAAATVPLVLCNVTLNLTNVASSNMAASAAEGAAYTTTLTPTGAYRKLGEITVTMGGTDISASAVSGSVVTIEKVTGDITITCSAVITNIVEAVGIAANTRLSTSAGSNKDKTGWAAIGANMDAASLIHLAVGDVLRIKGVGIPAASDGSSAIVKYNADGTFYSATYLYNGVHFNGMLCSDEGNGLIKIVNRESENDIRVSVICTDTTAVVVTINEEISY